MARALLDAVISIVYNYCISGQDGLTVGLSGISSAWSPLDHKIQMEAI